MQLASVNVALGDDGDGFVARPLLEADHCNTRVIRLGPSQALPPHTHAASDLMLCVLEGAGRIGTPDGDVAFTAGTVAHLLGSEELRVTNTGTTAMTLLAFLAPPFPPAAPSS